MIPFVGGQHLVVAWIVTPLFWAFTIFGWIVAGIIVTEVAIKKVRRAAAALRLWHHSRRAKKVQAQVDLVVEMAKEAMLASAEVYDVLRPGARRAVKPRSTIP